MATIEVTFNGSGTVASPPWAAALGGLWTQSGGVARAVSGGENAMAYTAATWDADHVAETTLGPMEPGTYVGVCVRTTGGQYVGFYTDGSAPADRYLFNESGALANTVQFTATEGGVLRLEATGTTITAFYNGLEIGQITTALTGGAPGLAAYDPGGSGVASWRGVGAQTGPEPDPLVVTIAPTTAQTSASVVTILATPAALGLAPTTTAPVASLPTALATPAPLGLAPTSSALATSIVGVATNAQSLDLAPTGAPTSADIAATPATTEVATLAPTTAPTSAQTVVTAIMAQVVSIAARVAQVGTSIVLALYQPRPRVVSTTVGSAPMTTITTGSASRTAITTGSVERIQINAGSSL